MKVERLMALPSTNMVIENGAQVFEMHYDSALHWVGMK